MDFNVMNNCDKKELKPEINAAGRKQSELGDITFLGDCTCKGKRFKESISKFRDHSSLYYDHRHCLYPDDWDPL